MEGKAGCSWETKFKTKTEFLGRVMKFFKSERKLLHKQKHKAQEWFAVYFRGINMKVWGD